FEELRDLNATTFLVSEMPRDATAFAHFGVEEFLADTIIHLRLREVDVGMSTSVRRYIGVVKMRGAEHDLDYFPLLVEHGTFEIVRPGLIIDGVSSNAFGPSARVSSADPYFAPVFGLWMFTGVALFVRSYWRVRKGPSQRMIGVVLGGLLLGTVPAAVTELLWPLLSASDTRVGLGSLYTLVWSIFIAYAVARYRYLVIEPVTELHTARAPRHRLERGLNYLVLENGRSAAMGAFRDIVSVTPGL